MADKIFDLVVQSYNPNTMIAKLIDPTEIDDVVEYDLFAPAYFGGHQNPLPKAGEALRIRYGRMGRGGFDNGIIACWRPRDRIQ